MTFNLSLPHSPACERNQDPIKEVLEKELGPQQNLLEVGFGTAQHAFYFSRFFPQVTYFAGDREQAHINFLQRSQVLGAPDNLKGPYQITATDETVLHNLDIKSFDTIYTANTLHIMSWKESLSFLKFGGDHLKSEGKLLIYGPFVFEGKFTSESNKSFDESLRLSDPRMGIRSFEEIEEVLQRKGLSLIRKYDLPANNQMLVFQKEES